MRFGSATFELALYLAWIRSAEIQPLVFFLRNLVLENWERPIRCKLIDMFIYFVEIRIFHSLRS